MSPDAKRLLSVAAASSTRPRGRCGETASIVVVVVSLVFSSSCHRPRLLCRAQVPEEEEEEGKRYRNRPHDKITTTTFSRRRQNRLNRPNENSRCSRKTARTLCIATEKSCPSYSRWEVPYTLQMCSGTALFFLSQRRPSVWRFYYCPAQ